MSAPTNVPLSKFREAGELVFLSGDLPFGDDGSIPEGIQAQTELTLDRIEATLASQNLSLDDVVSVNAYLVRKEDFGPFNEVYAKRFNQPYPARTTIRSDLMADGALLEITVVARRRS